MAEASHGTGPDPAVRTATTPSNSPEESAWKSGDTGGAPRAAIVALGTAVPRYRLEQRALGHWMAEQMVTADPTVAKWLPRLYKRSGIAHRYTCIPEPDRPRFLSGARSAYADVPTTAERMAIYERESVGLGAEAAKKALADLAGPPSARVARQVTHLIVVSCTGFFAPGLDAALVRELDLSPDVERTVIGFMGCAAAFNALRLASGIVAGRPSSLALIVCVELCTIHLQPSTDREQLVAASLFADGAAACLVGQVGSLNRADRINRDGGSSSRFGAAPIGSSHAFEIGRCYTHVQPEHGAEMSWSIGDHGFVMHLSSKIPELVSQAGPVGLSALWDDEGRPAFWAIHPGGRSILDRVAETFRLGSAEMGPSRGVLRKYGNLSSPTILFVLDALRRELRTARVGPGLEGIAMGFGPGFVTEMLRLRYVTAPCGDKEWLDDVAPTRSGNPVGRSRADGRSFDRR